MVTATAVDRNNNPVKSASIDWTVPKAAADLISISKPLNGSSDNAIVIVGLTPASGPAAATDIKISATSGGASGELVLHYLTEPTDITFVRASIDLAPGTKETIVARVFDAAGNELHGLNVTWKLADRKFEDLVFLGAPVNNAITNSIDVVWLRKQGQKATLVPIIARVGTASAVATINYQPEDKGNGNELVFQEGQLETNEVSIAPTEKKKITASVKTDNGAVLPKAQIDCDLADDDRDFVTINTKTKGEITLTGLGGNLDDASRTIVLPCRAEGARAVLVVRYDAGTIDVEWTVLSRGIAGDNYGRTVRNDYYCIDVTLHNKSGSDFTASLLRFVSANGQVVSIPIANYKTVHGSIARRKLTHPRSLMLAIVEGTGTLMTGFNPFFHNDTHAKNYSQFIDILSNPLKSGLEKAWKDPYPDELARFEENVLRDNTILKKDDDLKTTVFIPKRAVPFVKDEQAWRDDPVFVKEKLGRLEVVGYEFKRVGRRTFSSKP